MVSSRYMFVTLLCFSSHGFCVLYCDEHSIQQHVVFCRFDRLKMIFDGVFFSP